EFRTFCREDIFLIVGPSHDFANRETVTFEEMAREPIIMRDKGSATRRFVDEIFSSRHCKPNILLVSENIDFIKNVVSRGRGITFLSNEATSNELKEKNLIAVPVEGHFYSIDQVIAHLRDQPLSPNCRAFIECIVHKFLKNGEPFKSLSEARAVIRKMRKNTAQE
ncbi:MAG: LysR family transcriptional regulator substrate-binding protein, partial [Desulfatiglandales bacterium]